MSQYVNIAAPVQSSNFPGSLPFPSAPSVQQPTRGLMRLLVGSGAVTQNEFSGTSTFSEFLSAIRKYGITTNNRFFCQIEALNLSGFNPTISRRLGLFCKSASFPSVELKTTETEFIPSMNDRLAIYPDFGGDSFITLKFICSATMYERMFFQTWMSSVYNPTTNLMNFYDEYAKYNTITVVKMPKISGKIEEAVESIEQDTWANSRFYYTSYKECYPVKIEANEFQYGSSSGEMEISVKLSYKYYEDPVSFAFKDVETDKAIQEGNPLKDKYAEKLREIVQRGMIPISDGPEKLPAVDGIANAINGIVSRTTNVLGSIRQIF